MEIFMGNSVNFKTEKQNTFDDAIVFDQQKVKSEAKNLRNIFEHEKQNQGWVAKIWDETKENIGTSSYKQDGSGEKRAWYNPKRWASSVFDYDKSSEAVEKKLEVQPQTLEQLEQQRKALEGYESSQKNGVNTIADITAAGSAIGTIAAITCYTGGIGLPAAIAAGASAGAATKNIIAGTNTIGTDQKYGLKEIAYNTTTGAVDGAVAPIAGAVSSATGKILASHVASTTLIGASGGGAGGAAAGGIMGFTNGTAGTLKNGGTVGEALKNGTVQGAAGIVIGGVVGGTTSAISSAIKTNSTSAQPASNTGKSSVSDLDGNNFSKSRVLTDLHKEMNSIDPSTAQHGWRVSAEIKKPLEALGIDPKSPLGVKARAAALTHDIGKTQSPKIEELISLPRKLTGAEKAIVKGHTEFGADYLNKTEGFGDLASDMAKYHHTPYADLVKSNLPHEEIKIIQAAAFTDIKDALTGKGRNYLQEHSIKEIVPLIYEEAQKIIKPEYLPLLMQTL